MGQTCAALKRLYVHESQHDELCQKLADIADEKVIALVEEAKQQGATIYAGGARPDKPGYFFPPTRKAECVWLRKSSLALYCH